MITLDMSTSHGQKRKADDDLRNDQRLAKRLDRLHLGKILIPHYFYTADYCDQESNGKLQVPIEDPLPTPPVASYSPSMQVDDTRHRIFVHNLEDEIKEAERDEEKLLLLPDIEKKIGKIPNSVLTDDVHPSAHEKQVVLYGVPESLTIPKDKDSVRKAIMESRERARQAQDYVTAGAQSTASQREHALGSSKIQTHGAARGIPRVVTENVDEDAMDIG